jgi:hypothetical protein
MNFVYMYINALLTDLINSSVITFLLQNVINYALLKRVFILFHYVCYCTPYQEVETSYRLRDLYFMSVISVLHAWPFVADFMKLCLNLRARWIVIFPNGSD